MHKLQKLLLKRLQLLNNQRYGTLTSGYDFEDNIMFHLRKLIQERHINKDKGIYSITMEGIKEISKYEDEELEYKGIKTFFIGLLCENDSGDYLIKAHTNAKSNFYNLPGGKPFFGENIDESLSRISSLYLGFKMHAKEFKFVSLHLKTIKSNEGEVIFDDAFTIYYVKINDKQRSKFKLDNSVNWMSIEEIKKLNNRWPEIDICIINKDHETYKSYTHTSDYIL